MTLREHRTFWMPMFIDLRLLFLMIVFHSDVVVIGLNQEMRYTTSMVLVNSTVNTSSVKQRADESIQDVALLNSSYMLHDTDFKVLGSPIINPVLNTGNQSELLQLISTISFDKRPRDIFGNIFDRITDTTTSDIIKQYSSLNPKQYSTSNPKQYSSSNLTSEIEELVSFDVCRKYSSCEHVSNLTFKICHCDDVCLLYNDCCFDADIAADSTVSNDLQFDCLSSIIVPYATVKGYQVVKTCPADLKNTEIDIKCQSDDIFLIGPWVITDSNIVFKNRFCATCNNISDYHFFDVKFTYAKDTATQNTPSIVLAALQDLYKERVDNSLVVEFIAPVDANLRQCVVTRKPINESKHCLTYYTSPVFVRRDKYRAVVRNTFCIEPEYTFDMCVGRVNPFLLDLIENHDVFPMTVLFQFQQSCQGEFDVNGVCFARIYEKRIEQDYSLISSTDLTRGMIEEILTVMAWSFSDEIKTNHILYSYTQKKIDNQFPEINVTITGQVMKMVSYEESLNIDNKLKEAQWLLRVSRQNGLIFEVNAISVKSNDRSWHSTSFRFFSRLNQVKVDLKDNFRKQLCAKSIIECESKTDSDNPKTVIKNLTCGVDFIQKQPSFASSTNLNMNVITYTGMGISVVALTTSILIYRRLGMHRSIPGSNVENLSIALLISDIIFMLGIGANDLSLVCYSVGVTLHYLWLLVFSFKCIALIHMCYNLTNMSLIAKDSGVDMSSKRPHFTLLGILLPSLFVVPAVIIDVLEIQGVSIDYSGSICFPTGYPGNLIFVSGPIGLAVVINIACLLCIAGVITKQSLGIRHIRRSNSFQYLPVFVRISLVTGMLWITGLLGAIIQNEVMEYLFVICCSFQGLLIAVGNLTTKRIYREIRQRKQILTSEKVSLRS